MSADIIARIVVERLDANSDEYRLSSLCVADRTVIDVGQAVAIIETSKSVFEIVSPAAGRLFLAPGVDTASAVHAGQLLAVITPPDANGDTLSDAWRSEDTSEVPQGPVVRGATFSKAAVRKLQELGVSPEVFIDKGLVTASDVDAHFRDKT